VLQLPACSPAQQHCICLHRKAAADSEFCCGDTQVAGEHKVVAVDDEADCAQLLRTLAEVHAAVPQWRRQRPCLLADAAHFFPGPGAESGTLTVRCSSICGIRRQCKDVENQYRKSLSVML
jgi:hypothetical protein